MRVTWKWTVVLATAYLQRHIRKTEITGRLSALNRSHVYTITEKPKVENAPMREGRDQAKGVNRDPIEIPQP